MQTALDGISKGWVPPPGAPHGGGKDAAPLPRSARQAAVPPFVPPGAEDVARGGGGGEGAAGEAGGAPAPWLGTLLAAAKPFKLDIPKLELDLGSLKLPAVAHLDLGKLGTAMAGRSPGGGRTKGRRREAAG